MVIGVFVTMSIASGLGFYNASVILRAATQELGASVTAVSAATALFFGISGIAGFVASPWMERFDVRRIYVAGGLTGAAALAGLRFVDNVPALFVFFALFGVGFSLSGLVPGTTVVARWFRVRRSVALSIATTGLSVGGIVLTPVAARLIDDRSLAGAGPLMAVAWLSVIPIAYLLIRSRPEDVGLEPDGAAAPEPLADGATAAPSGATFAEATGTRFFRALSVAYALIFLAQVGGLAQLFNLGAERLDTTAAAAALSTLAFSSVVGRLVGGVVVTRVPAKAMTAALTLLQAVALSMIALADTRAALVAAAGVFGLSVGNLLMLQPLLLAEVFGVREYSRIYSLNQLFGTIGVAGGPFLIGFVRDLADYEVAMFVGAGANIAALVVLWIAGPVDDARAVWSDPAPAPALP